MPKVAILVGDLVGSRGSSDRQKLQSELTRSIETVNNEVNGNTIAPIEIVRGDEFEGGFTDPASCLEAFFALERELFPVRYKAGIGIGTISTTEETSISRMDGPAFHRARSAVEEAQTSSASLVVKSSDQHSDELVNTILDLVFLIRDSWTNRQRQIVNYYQGHKELTQSEIAFHFDISQPAVAKVLQRTKVNHIDRAKAVLENELKVS